MKSSEETIAQSRAQIDECIALIKALYVARKRIVFVGDSDGVVTSSDSDALGRVVKGEDSLANRFALEERLALQPLRPGPWLPIAERCARIGASIYIVTARSTFANPRLLWFCLEHDIPAEWILGVGHQSKRGSYEIILREYANDPDCHFIYADDSLRHMEDFQKLIAELGIEDRCHVFHAIPIFDHTEEEYRAYYDAVMNATASSMLDAVSVNVPGFGELLVVPDRRAGLKRIQEEYRKSLLAAAALLAE
ncbi:MAG: hypothetical protein Q7R85_03465 [bacterium]|nr:hypothetical protein [bacterium]